MDAMEKFYSCLEICLEEFFKDNPESKVQYQMGHGCLNAYQFSGNIKYKEFLMQILEQLVQPDGSIAGENPYDQFLLGQSLVFAAVETRLEKYQLAADYLYQELKRLPKTEEGLYYVQDGCTRIDSIKAFALLMPFYMAYETQFNKKANYNDIAEQWKKLRYLYFKEETGKYTDCIIAEAMLLNALADTSLAASEEIFEHYQGLRIQLKEALQGILPYVDKETGIFLGSDQTVRLAASAQIAAAVRKGCRNEALLKEKYEEVMTGFIEALPKYFVDYQKDKAAMAALMQFMCGRENDR